MRATTSQTRERMRLRSQNLKEAGICRGCGKQALKGKSRCGICSHKNKEDSSNRRKRHKSLGLCVCGRTPRPGKLSCEKCGSSYLRADKEKVRAYQVKRREKHRRLRMCHCGNPSLPSQSRCERCLTRHKANQQALYQKRKEQGLCVFCGNASKDGRTVCLRCFTKRGKLRRYLPALLKRQEGLCSGCGREFSDSLQPQVDHLIPKTPMKKCLPAGDDSAKNCCNAICRGCNMIKLNRIMTMGELREENKRLGRLPQNPKFPEAQGDDIVASYRERFMSVKGNKATAAK